MVVMHACTCVHKLTRVWHSVARLKKNEREKHAAQHRSFNPPHACEVATFPHSHFFLYKTAHHAVRTAELGKFTGSHKPRTLEHFVVDPTRNSGSSNTAFSLSISSSWHDERSATLRCVATPHHHPSSHPVQLLACPVEPSNSTMCQRGLCTGTVRSFSVACAQSERNHTPCFVDGCFMCG